MTGSKKIAAAAATIGSATLLSRVLGYGRDAAVAAFFGAGFMADAFFVAFRLSNLLRRLVGEGALTSSFVPVFTEVAESRPRGETKRFVDGFFTLFFLIVVALSFLGIFLSGWLVELMSPGFSGEKRSVTVALTMLMFPYMIFVGLTATSMGVLNSFGHFATPAAAPAIFNVVVIGSVVLLSGSLSVYSLAIGVLLGGFFQFAAQLAPLKKYGALPGPCFFWKDAEIKKIFLLMAPAALGVGVYQFNIFVTMRFASHLAEGSVSYLYYAARLVELPLGVFGVAFAQATLPRLAEYAVNKDMTSFKDSLSFAMRMVNFVSIPSAVGLFVVGLPIVEMLFSRGEFGQGDALQTYRALWLYALGLAPVALSRIFVTAFYSLKDAATPVYAALASIAANIIFSFLLMGPLGHGGLALASSLSSLINFFLLAAMLRLKMGGMGLGAAVISFLKCCVAAVVMGVIVYAVIFYSGWEGGAVRKAFLLLLAIVAGMVLYVLASRALRVKEVDFLREILVKSRG